MQMTTAAEDRGMGKVWVAYDDMNVDKCKIMISNDWVDNTEIQIGNAAVEMTEEFCYLGSKYVTSNSSCDKDNKNRQSQQPSTVHWNISGTKRKPGRPRKNWIDTTEQDLKSIGMIWEVEQRLVVNREGWRRRVVMCL